MGADIHCRWRIDTSDWGHGRHLLTDFGDPDGGRWSLPRPSNPSGLGRRSRCGKSGAG